MRKLGSVRRLWLVGAVPIVAVLCSPSVALADNNAGSGSMVGTMTFTAGQPLQVGGDNFSCSTDNWTMPGTAAFAVVFDVPAAAYPGPISTYTQGGSTCTATTHEIGTWSMAMQSTGPLGQFNCGTVSPFAAGLSGIYLRIGAEELVDVTTPGSCSVGRKPEGSVEFVAAGQLVPEQTTGSQINSQAWAGAFVLYPAL
jgi:hypothetical protein